MRVAWVVLAVLSGGIFLLVYIVMMIVVPLAPAGLDAEPRAAAAGRRRGRPGRVPRRRRAGPGARLPAGPGRAPPAGGQWTPPPAGPARRWKAPDPGNAGIVFGFILVGLGVWFLIDQYVHIDWQLLWPVIVILIGVALIVAAMRRSRPSA